MSLLVFISSLFTLFTFARSPDLWYIIIGGISFFDMETRFLVFPLLLLWFEAISACTSFNIVIIALYVLHIYIASVNTTRFTNSTRPTLSQISRLPFALNSSNSSSTFQTSDASYLTSSATVKPNATKTDNRTSTCLLVTPSPSDWLPEWAFAAAYKDSDPCKFAYCRSSHLSRFPNESVFAALRKTITGIFTTSTVIPTIVTQNNQTSVSNSTSWYPTRGATTLSSLSAWWGNSWNEPCCDVCHLEAGTIALRYWPTSPSASEATTVVENGYTFSYPSIYWAFNTIAAVDGCSTIGTSDHSDEIIAFDPSEVSSLSPIIQTVSGSTEQILQTYSIDWEKVYNGNCENVAGYVIDDPANLDPYKHDACHPRIAVPSGFLTKVDPKWSNCINDDLPFGYYDPPRALVPASALAPTPTALASSPTTLPAPEQGVPASPTAKSTAAPAPAKQSPANNGASSPDAPGQSSSNDHLPLANDLGEINNDPKQPPEKLSPPAENSPASNELSPTPKDSPVPPNKPSLPENPSPLPKPSPPTNISPPSIDPAPVPVDSPVAPSKHPPLQDSSPPPNELDPFYNNPSTPLKIFDNSGSSSPPASFNNPPSQAPHDYFAPTKVSASNPLPEPEVPQPRIFTIDSLGALVLPSQTLISEGPNNAHPSPISISIASDRAVYVDNTLLGILPTPPSAAVEAARLITTAAPVQVPTAGARAGAVAIAPDAPTLVAFPAASATTLMANGATITIKGQSLNIDAAARIVVDGTTLAENSAAIRVNGHILNLDAAAEMIDGAGSYVPFPVTTQAAILTLGGNPITAFAGASPGVIILGPGTTISAGGAAATTIDGTIVSINSAGAIIVDGTSTVFPSAMTLQSLLPSKAAVLTLGGKALTAIADADTRNIILGPGTTISAGGAATRIDGTVVSVDSSGAIILDGTSTLVPSFVALPSILPSKAAILTLGGKIFTAIANPGSSEIILGPGTTISANGPPATIDGTVIGVNSAGAVILDGTKTIAPSAFTLPYNLPPKTAILTLGGEILTAIASPGSNEIILGPGTTISAGGAPATIDGIVISVNPAGAVVLDGTKTVLPSAFPLPSMLSPETAIFTLNGHIFTAITGANSPGVITLGPGTTISANGAAATIDGTIVSANSAGEIIIGETSTVIPSIAATRADVISAASKASDLTRWISHFLHGGVTADRDGAITDGTMISSPSGAASGSWSTSYVSGGSSGSSNAREAEVTLGSSADSTSSRPMIAESMTGKRKHAGARELRIGMREWGCALFFWLGVWGLGFLRVG